jgi:catechol 2,3-dioxygenase-like lactoylglutathione lyase family enzyme
MTSRILAIAVDCPSDQVKAAEEFWCAALGLHVARRWTDPKGVDRDAEVARLTGLGARVVDADPALPWVVCADPVGNEFCVLPPR